jgi:hypothetical protein
MSGRVLVMCASRGRPDLLQRMIESVRATTTRADIAVYLDDDDPEDYLATRPRAELGGKVVVGPRVTPVEAVNLLAAQNPDYQAFGWAVDDSEFLTPDWDRWVLEKAAGFRGGIGAMAPHTLEGAPERMDFPWLTRGWVEVCGNFVPYPVEHFYWDVALQLLGEATQIAFASEQEFCVRHLGVMPDQEPPAKDGKVTQYGLRILRSHTDARTTCRWIALERQPLIEKLMSEISRRGNA